MLSLFLCVLPNFGISKNIENESSSNVSKQGITRVYRFS